jgi:hypothetical protein
MVCHIPSAHTGVGSIPDFLVVRSQTGSLTPSLYFDHNLCCRCLNGSCEAIFDIYTSKPFQRYKEHLKARCFELYNRALKLWESRRTPSSHFWECESHPHTGPQSGVATKCVKLDERVAKKLFDERWFVKHCVEQGNALHVTIKTNEPLLMNA